MANRTSRDYEENSSIVKAAIVVLAGIFTVAVGLTVIFGSWYTIDQTARGVLLRNGALIGTAQPGLGFKMPWIETVQKFYVTSKIETYVDMEAYSSDQQPAHLKVSVNWRPDAAKIAELYTRFATLENAVARSISPHVAQQVKIVFGQYTAVRAIQERAKLNMDVRNSIIAALDKDMLLLIESIQIEDIQFSKAYMASIEQRMLAEVEVQRLRQNAEREKVQAQIVVTQAQAKADATVAGAKAEAEAVILRGNAEAQAIKARGDALSQNPKLVELITAERWDGKLPATMLPGSAVPFVSVK